MQIYSFPEHDAYIQDLVNEELMGSSPTSTGTPGLGQALLVVRIRVHVYNTMACWLSTCRVGSKRWVPSGAASIIKMTLRLYVEVT